MYYTRAKEIKMIGKKAKQIRGGMRAIAFVACMLFAAACMAKVANPHVVPVQATYVFSVPDTGKLYNACTASPFPGIVKDILEAVGGKDQLGAVQAFLPEIEKELGFKLDAETVTKMIPALDLFMANSAESDKPVVGLVATEGDKDKFQHFLNYWEKAAIKAAAESQSDDEASTASEKKHEFITTSTVEGCLVKHFVAGNGMDVYYAEADSLFLVATDNNVFTSMLARAKGKKKEGGFNSASDFEKVSKAISARDGVLYMYQNNKAVFENAPRQPELQKLYQLMHEFAAQDMAGTVIEVKKDSVRSYHYSPFAPGSENTLIRKLMERASNSSSIEIMKFAPEQVMVAGGTNAFDAFLIYDFMRDLINSLSGNSKDTDIDKQLKDLEPLLGFSVKEDLLPACGNELGLIVSSLDFSSSLPAVDLALLMKVRDKDKMQKVLTAVERQVDDKVKQMAPQGPDKDKAPNVDVSFKTAKEGDLSIRYLDIPPLPTVTPAYAFVGDYLIIASTKETVSKLAAVKNGKEKSLVGSQLLGQYQGVTPRGMSFGYVNLSAVWDSVGQIASKAADKPAMDKVLDALRKIHGVAGYAEVKDGAVVGESVLLFSSDK